VLGGGVVRLAAAVAVLAAVFVAAGFAVGVFGGGGVVRVVAATTTSLYATGLLDYLEEEFKRVHPGVEIDFVAVGSGEALRRAAQGDACLVFVHAPSLEKRYIEAGVLAEGWIFAYNFFVIVGPEEDPANVSGAGSAVEAFRRIFRAGEAGLTVFVSRGDGSGTHVRELMIWGMAGLDPRGRPWYVERGAGMAETLVTASELGGYTLSDIGTFLKLRAEGRIPNLLVLYSNSSELINIYSVYVVSSCRGPEREAALAFARFIAGPGQELIAVYGVEEFGEPLFYPAAGRLEELKELWERLAEG
jgi:tungstate transport system substrate-binding protein